MMTTISNEERGLLFKNGSFVKALKDGKYYAFFGRRIETVDINGPIFSELCSLETLLKDEIISVSYTHLVIYIFDITRTILFYSKSIFDGFDCFKSK